VACAPRANPVQGDGAPVRTVEFRWADGRRELHELEARDWVLPFVDLPEAEEGSPLDPSFPPRFRVVRFRRCQGTLPDGAPSLTFWYEEIHAGPALCPVCLAPAVAFADNALARFAALRLGTPYPLPCCDDARCPMSIGETLYEATKPGTGVGLSSSLRAALRRDRVESFREWMTLPWCAVLDLPRFGFTPQGYAAAIDDVLRGPPWLRRPL